MLLYLFDTNLRFLKLPNTFYQILSSTFSIKPLISLKGAQIRTKWINSGATDRIEIMIEGVNVVITNLS